jgi:hypothetical protein
VVCLKNLKWGKVVFNNADDESYRRFIEDLSLISGVDNIMCRKDNEDVWIEYESYAERQYVVKAKFTEQEISYLKKYYKHNFWLDS